MDFISRLNQVVAELKADPSICVLAYNVLPANLDAIAEVEANLGYQLDSAITDFYKTCGGVQLMWLNEDNEQFERAQSADLPETLDTWYIKGEHLSFNLDGSIWIPGIDVVFGTDWAENGMEVYIDDFDEEITLGYEGFKIQVLDWFSAFYDVAFLINGTGNPPLLLGNDNQVCYTDSHLINFATYLELLLKTKGSIEARVDFLDTQNDAIDGFATMDDVAAYEC